jgi:DNA helicase II / ATP-dependent DNA helicase PcrA
MSSLLENLNEQQLKAVTHTVGPLLIVAGAGTGKTTVITRRIAYLVQQKQALPDQILALTFTEKAATEMAERVDTLVPLGMADSWISTFHGFCQRLLEQHALDIGLSNDFKLLDTTRQWVLVHNNFDRFELDYYRPLGNPHKFIDALLSHFSKCKDECISPEEYLDYAQKLQLAGDSPELLPSDDTALEVKRVSEIAKAYHTYQQLLVENEGLDFGDLITYALKLLQTRPNILQYYQKHFKYILVDEFQDTNFAQYQLVKLLGGPQANLVVVGDDDQAIYKFRGASVSNILQFQKEYPKLAQVTLSQNYRSAQNILDLAYTFIQHNNPDRLETKLGINKHLENPGKDEGIVEVLEGSTLAEELDKVIKTILKVKSESTETKWNDFAILIRSNAAAGEVLPRLEAAGIPFTYLANKGLYKKPFIQKLLAYLKLLDNYHESAALFQVLQFPNFQLPATDLAFITHNKNKKTLSMYEALQNNEIVGQLVPESQTKIKHLLELLDTHTKAIPDRTAVELFVYIIKDLGVPQWLEADTLENAQNRELLEQFYHHVEEYEQENSDKTLRGFLQSLDLEMRAGNEGKLNFDPNSGPETVKLMTIHASKGLEFESVFVINMVDQRFPTRAKKDAIEVPTELVKDILPEGDFHLQEERRLFYVAMTRAKKRLYFSWAKNYGGTRGKKPSLFLEEAGLVTKTKGEGAVGKVVFTKDTTSPRKQVFKVFPAQFSYSDINTFLKCPLEYKLKNYLKLPLPGAAPLSFGISMHCTLQRYMEEYKRLLDNPIMDLFGTRETIALPSLQRLEQMYEQEWIDEWYLDKNQKDFYRKKGIGLLKTFYEASQAVLPKPKYIEKFFKLKIGEYNFVGKMDRADASDQGLRIIDYKTGLVPKAKKDLDADQLRIYQWAAIDFLKEPVESLDYWYLEENIFKNVPLATNDELVSLQESLLETIQQIVETIKYDTFAELHKKSSQHTCNFDGWE